VRIPPGSTTTADVAVASIGHFRGTINFSCTIEPDMPGWECAVSGAVQGSGNVTVNITAAKLDSHQVIAVVTGTSGLLSRTISIPMGRRRLSGN
jgi:hypothetical protein